MGYAEAHDPLRRCLRLEEWPEVDRQAWNAAITGGDIFDNLGPGANWSAATRRKYFNGYARWLGYLQRQGWLDPATPPADRVTPEHVRAYLNALRQTMRDFSLVGRLDELFAVVRAIAPERDWSWIRRPGGISLRSNLTMAKRPISVPSAEALLTLGQNLMQSAESLSGPVRQMVQHRDGLLFALLAAVPMMRMRNLSTIEVARHLLVSDGHFRLVFPAQETKTKRRLEAPVPEALTFELRRYLEVYRPRLLQGREHSFLWVNWGGEPLGNAGIQKRFRWVIRKHLGVNIGPHAFRHAAATIIAVKDPAHVQIIAPILGHTSRKTAEAHYNRATMAEAAVAFRRSLRHIRKTTRPNSIALEEHADD